MLAALKLKNDEDTARRIAILLIVLICILAQAALLYSTREKIRGGSPDFIDFYAGGRIVATGNGSHLFDLPFQAQIEAAAAGRSNANYILPFVHPPFFALWMVPLGLIPYPAAYYVWWICNQCFFWLTLLLIDRVLGGETLRPARVACAGLLFLPVIVAFWQGQDSVLNLFLFTLAYLLLSRGRAGLAGAVIGVAAFKPQLAMLMLVLLLFTSRGKLRLAAGFVLSCVVQVALAVAVLGWSLVASYPKALASVVATYEEKNFDPNSMPNLWGFLHFLLAPHLPHTVLAGVNIALSGLLLLGTIFALRSRNARMQPESLRYGLALIAAFLTAYHGHFHDMSVFLLPLLFAWHWLAARKLHGLDWRLLALSVAVPFAGLLIAGLNPKLLPPMLACAGLFFWAMLLWNLVTVSPAPVAAPAAAD
jgi:hypothetical protein